MGVPPRGGGIYLVSNILQLNKEVGGKKPQMSVDLMSNSPFLYKEVKSNLLAC